MHTITFEMIALPPFRLDLTVWALRRRAANSIDLWHDDRYSRTVVLDPPTVLKMDVAQKNRNNSPILQITLSSVDEVDDRTMMTVRSLVRTMLGLDIDLGPFYSLAEDDEVLQPLVNEFIGIKPPRFPTLFEAMVNAIACQQISLDAGIQILDQFAERFGRVIEEDTTALHSFPIPEDLARVSEEEIKRIGLTMQKARSIREIARSIRTHEAVLADAYRMTNAEIVSYLSTIRGIGRWSAEYVLLRGLGRLDTFPGDDVGARNNIQRLFHLEEKPDYDQIKKLTSRWQPYQGLVYFHLLLKNLRAKGAL